MSGTERRRPFSVFWAINPAIITILAALSGCAEIGRPAAVSIPTTPIEGREVLPEPTKQRPAALLVDAPSHWAETAGEPWGPFAVTLLDATGAPIPEDAEVRVSVVLSDASASLLGTVSHTVHDGRVRFDDLRYEVAESVLIDIVADGDYAGRVERIHLRVDPAPADRLEVGLSQRAVRAGHAVSVTVTARDAYGNLATGYRGDVHVHTIAPHSTVPDVLRFTEADAGKRVAPVALTLRAAGDWQVTAVDFDPDGPDPATRVLRVQPDDAATFQLRHAPDTIRAGWLIPLEVRALDAFGNVATDFSGPVALSSTDPMAVVDSAVVDAGRGEASIRLHTAGTQHVVVADADPADEAGRATIHVTPAHASSIEFTASPRIAYAAVPLSPPPTVVIEDEYGNQITKPTAVLLRSDSGDLVGVTGVIAVDGVAIFSDVGFVAPVAGTRLRAEIPQSDPVAISPRLDVFEPLDDSLSSLELSGSVPHDADVHGRGQRLRPWLSGFSGALADPGPIVVDDVGTVYIGQESGGDSPRPVLRVTPTGQFDSSTPFATPTAVAAHDLGLQVAAGDRLINAGSVDGASDAVWATVTGAQFTDVVLDAQRLRVTALDGPTGRVVEIDGQTGMTRLRFTLGEPGAIALHPDTGEVFVLSQSSGELWVLDPSGDAPPVAVDVLPVDTAGRMDFHVVGEQVRLVVVATVATETGVYRWDPGVGQGSFEPWITGLAEAEPLDVACGGLSGADPLYVTTRNAGVLALDCPVRGPGVPHDMLVVPSGWHLQVAGVAQGAPIAVAYTDDGGLITVGEADADGYAPITFLDSTGMPHALPSVMQASSVAVDGQGRIYVAGGPDIFRAESVDDALDADAWALWTTLAADVSALAIDQAHDDRVWATRLDGSVTRIAQTTTRVTVPFGPVGLRSSVAIDGQGSAWILDANDDLTRVGFATLQVVALGNLADSHPDYVGNAGIVSGRDGDLFVAARFVQPHRHAIARWSPQTDALEEWVITTEPDVPAALARDTQSGCLAFATEGSSRIHRACPCD